MVQNPILQPMQPSDRSKTISLGEDFVEMSRKDLSAKLMKIKDEGYNRIGIDMSKNSYVNSEVIGMIAYSYVVLHELGTELYIVNPLPGVKKILVETGLNKIIRVDSSDSE